MKWNRALAAGVAVTMSLVLIACASGESDKKETVETATNDATVTATEITESAQIETETKTMTSEEAYGSTIAGLGDEDLFALVNIGDMGQVLLVTDQYYDEGSEKQASIFCDVYYNFDGEVKNLGTIDSQGTAYPISYDDTGIYVSGGHFLGRYVINTDTKELEVAEHYLEEFDTEGNAKYTLETGDQVKEITEEDFLNAFDEKLGNATIVHFAYGASDAQ